MNRRSLLSLLGGAGAAASVGVRPSDVLRASATAPAGYAIGGLGYPTACGEPIPPSPFNQLLNQHRHEISMALSRREAMMSLNIPAHIMEKRSWSMAFKVSEAAKEIEEISRARTALWDDDWLTTFLKDRGIL